MATAAGLLDIEAGAVLVRIDVAQTSATSTLMRGSHLRGPAFRPAGLSLRPEGIQSTRIPDPAVARRPYSPARIRERLRAAGVPVDRLTEIARGLDNRWHGDPAKAAQVDAEIMEDLAPLRARANRTELPDWE